MKDVMPYNTIRMDLREAKRALRTDLAAKLKAICDIECQSEAIQRHLIASEAYKKAQRLGIYLAMQGNPEVNTKLVVEDALRVGKTVYYWMLRLEQTRLNDPQKNHAIARGLKASDLSLG